MNLSVSEKQMIKDGADGEYINVEDKRILQDLGLTQLFLGRIVSSTDDVPEVPADLTPILWIAPFASSDRTSVHLRQARATGPPACSSLHRYPRSHALSSPFITALGEEKKGLGGDSAAQTHQWQAKAQFALSARERHQRAGQQKGALRAQAGTLLHSAEAGCFAVTRNVQ